MPSGIYKRTDKYKKECKERAKKFGYKPPSGSYKGHKWTEERKLEHSKKRRGVRTSVSSEFKKGHKGMRGEQSPNWKGGITSETQARVNTTEWKELRKEIYERDNWTCQLCKKHCRKSIQCHHITPYRISNDNSKSNLITLCISCHIKVEWNWEHYKVCWDKI